MLKLFPKKEEEIVPKQEDAPIRAKQRWWCSWEIYPLLLIAAFFRFFNLNKVLFVDDQAGDFQRAYNAVAHGLWPVTGNLGSLNYVHPTLSIYFFMIPAAISSNPLGGEILVALVNTAAVLLTYFFVRRYYGRLAGTIAAFLYATSVAAWSFSRDIWSPNFLTFFVILFFFALFRGVVERRKGWLFPALVLLGVLYQLHESSILLGVCLLAAVIFAFQTIRLRDVLYAIPVLLLLFAPYLVWELHVHFFDIIGSFKAPPPNYAQGIHGFDFESVRIYFFFFFSPKLSVPYTNGAAWANDNHLLLPNGQSVLFTSPLRHFQLFLKLDYRLMLLVVFCSLALLALLVLSPRFSSASSQSGASTSKSGLARWWSAFYSSPERQGIALLLIWQIIPLLYLLHHTIVLFVHYMLFFLPGPFILVALGLTKNLELLQRFRPHWKKLAGYATCCLVVVLISAQFIGNMVSLLDQTSGHIPPGATYAGAQFSDLNSLQNALQEADQLAQQHHVHRIYGVYNNTYNKAIKYLSEFMQTPVELYNPEQCMPLPSSAAEPAIFLTMSHYAGVRAVLSTYTNATLLAQPPRLGYPASPFQIYLVTPKASPEPVAQTFTSGLQALSSNAQLLRAPDDNFFWLTTRWRMPDTHKAVPLTTYNYNFKIQPSGAQFSCSFTATWAGDQFFVFQGYALNTPVPSILTIQASTDTTGPDLHHVGSLTLETSYMNNTPTQNLLTADGHNSVTFTVSK